MTPLQMFAAVFAAMVLYITPLVGTAYVCEYFDSPLPLILGIPLSIALPMAFAFRVYDRVDP